MPGAGSSITRFFEENKDQDPKADNLEVLCEDLSNVASPTLIGNGQDLIRQFLEQNDAQSTFAGADLPQVPDMGVVAKWALHQPESHESPAPLYLRAPDAKPQVGKAIARA